MYMGMQLGRRGLVMQIMIILNVLIMLVSCSMPSFYEGSGVIAKIKSTHKLFQLGPGLATNNAHRTRTHVQILVPRKLSNFRTFRFYPMTGIGMLRHRTQNTNTEQP